MKKKWMLPAAVLLLAAAAVIVGLQVRAAQLAQEKAGAVILRMGGKETAVPIRNLDREAFSGETVNGKGEHFTHSYRGIELSALLREAGASPDSVMAVKAVAADQYSAEYTGDEVRKKGCIYLAVQTDGKMLEGIEPGTPGVQVIVFGDADSKRAVRNLSALEDSMEE